MKWEFGQIRVTFHANWAHDERSLDLPEELSTIRSLCDSSTISFSINAAINPITKLEQMLNLVCVCLKVESAWIKHERCLGKAFHEFWSCTAWVIHHCKVITVLVIKTLDCLDMWTVSRLCPIKCVFTYRWMHFTDPIMLHIAVECNCSVFAISCEPCQTKGMWDSFH